MNQKCWTKCAVVLTCLNPQEAIWRFDYCAGNSESRGVLRKLWRKRAAVFLSCVPRVYVGVHLREVAWGATLHQVSGAGGLHSMCVVMSLGTCQVLGPWYLFQTAVQKKSAEVEVWGRTIKPGDHKLSVWGLSSVGEARKNRRLPHVRWLYCTCTVHVWGCVRSQCLCIWRATQ